MRQPVNSRIFRYEFEDAPPSPKDSTAPSQGAFHGAEIEFVFEDLASKNLPWRPEDEKLSNLMSSYWTNFAKTGNPNGRGLPHWPAYNGHPKYQVMHLWPPCTKLRTSIEPGTSSSTRCLLRGNDNQDRGSGLGEGFGIRL